MRSVVVQSLPGATESTVWRCGGRQCGSGECDHDDEELRRHASGSGPAVAPASVHDVLRSSGVPLPQGVRLDMEARLGHDFADVRVHTDARAGESAREVEALAYTVGRHVVFGPAQFDPASPEGRQLLAHELIHASASRQGGGIPTGDIRVSSPEEPAEVYAARNSTAATRLPISEPGTPGLLRQAAAVPLTGLSVNHSRVTIPPEPTLAFSARVAPANATGVALTIVGDNATIDAATTINSTTGAITVAVAQTGGSAHVEASQSITTPLPGGATSTSTSTRTAPFHFVAVPGAVSSTTASTRGATGEYGGNMRQTFTGGNAIERAHVNERFSGASTTQQGTFISLTGAMLPGGARIHVNDPNAAAAGWDLDSSGEMVADDQVTWTVVGATARPFIANASNPTPSATLPQSVDALQSFHNLSFPSRNYSAAAVASVTHRRMFEERSGSIQAVTRALPGASTTPEVVEDYAGPPVFRNCTANPASVAPSVPRGRGAPPANTSSVQVDRDGSPSPATAYSIPGPALGCSVNARTGRVTIGSTAGAVRVRAGDATNYDETTITIAAPTPTPTPTPGTPGPPGTPGGAPTP